MWNKNLKDSFFFFFKMKFIIFNKLKNMKADVLVPALFDY